MHQRHLPLLIGFLSFILETTLVSAADWVSVSSPDHSIQVSISTQGQLKYTVALDGQPLLGEAKLGLDFHDGTVGNDVTLTKQQRDQVNSTWNNPWGKRSRVRDHHNELRLTFRENTSSGRTFTLAVRVFDDGIGFRYELPEQNGWNDFVLERDATEFTFAGNYPCFMANQDGFVGAQEYEFNPAHIGDIQVTNIIGLPLLVKTPAAWVAVAESDLRDWSGLWLHAGTNSSNGGISLNSLLAPILDKSGLVTGTLPHHSPWTVLMIARQPGQLIESDLINNLSTPNQLSDTSWIHPGKMAWDHWWSGDTKMDTATLKNYIQLAADMGWPYQLIDWYWYGVPDQTNASILNINAAVNMPEVLRFAKERNVRLWVWLHSNDVDRNDDYLKAFPRFEEWGIAGVKIDFMNRDDQAMVEWYEKITKAAAEHHLMVNFHGAFKPSGFSRTYPNQITREGILGNEYNKWSARVTPEHKATLPFTRFLVGPGDFTPGGFLNRQPSQFKPQNPTTVQGTRCEELSLFVCFDSPLCCVCDAPEHYQNQPGADFLKIVPTVWDDTKVLDAEVGQHLVMARRSGKEWFLGGLTDRNARTITVPLNFLGSGHWKLHWWKDAPDADQNAEHLVTEDRMVTAKDQLELKFAPSGGTVGHFEKL